MPIQQVQQLVSSFELLVEPISPVPIPPTSTGSSVLSSSNGGANGGTATAVAPSAAEVVTSAGTLSRIVRQIASNANAPTIVTPIAIQGYFVWITNLSSAPLVPVITVNADPEAIKTLTAVTDPSNPLTATVLAITSVGNRSLGMDGNIFDYLKPVNGVPTITLPAAIPAGGTALFTLVGNYALFSDLTEANLEVRGSLSIGIDPSSSAQFAPLLLEPQTRTVYVTPGFPSPAETAFALPTARGNARYTLPGPAFFIKSLLNGYVLDAAGPITTASDGEQNTQVVINPVSGSPTQLWYFTSDGFIVNAANNFVLDLQGTDTDNDTPVIVYPRKAANTSNQQWNLTADGAIQSQQANVVLDVSGGNTSPGAPVIIYTPNGGKNQQWLLFSAVA